jgi:hypothetical protein
MPIMGDSRGNGVEEFLRHKTRNRAQGAASSGGHGCGVIDYVVASIVIAVKEVFPLRFMYIS